MPIFDQGYQHWHGPLAGHAWRWLAIARHGTRVQLKNRRLRFLLLAAWTPALALVVAVAVWGLIEQKSAGVMALVQTMLPPGVLLDPQAFRSAVWTLSYSFFFKAEMFFIMLLVITAGPGLISGDLRFNALPLYFARPLTRFDYFLGKLGVIGALVAAVAVVPAAFAYLIGVCFSLNLSVVRDTWPVLLASVAYGLVITLSAGTLILAMSSLSRRSLYVGIAWAGLWIISGSVGGLLHVINRETVYNEARAAALARWVEDNPPPPGVKMHGAYPHLQWQSDTKKMVPAGVPAGQEAEAEHWYRRWQEASRRASTQGQVDEAAVARADWRPLCSYVANLERIADALLDTDSAWVTLGRAAAGPQAALGGGMGRRGEPQPFNERRLADQMVPQYPWVWSAGVLAGLVGLSLCILTMRVKSLDRLK